MLTRHARKILISLGVAGAVLAIIFFTYGAKAALRGPVAIKQNALTPLISQFVPKEVPAKPPLVYVAYLVPSDKAIRADYKAGVEKAVKELQRWYRMQMGNTKTFKLNSPTVVVFKTTHPSSWYAQTPNGDFSVSFWNNVVGDGFKATGGKFNDPNYRWVYYIDADPVCGQTGGAGTSGVTALPANDLRGLVGEQNIPPCASQIPDYGGVCRWIGGLGHELGHAFGLPHPAQCESTGGIKALSCPSDTLMWFGYMYYPYTYLLEENKKILNQGGFFDFALATPSAPLCGQ